MSSSEIPRLAKRIARKIKPPPDTTYEDVAQDAAVFLLTLQKEWDDEPNSLPNWARDDIGREGTPAFRARLVRLVRWRLADKYGTRTHDGFLPLADNFDVEDHLGVDDPVRAEITAEVRAALDQLTDRQRRIVRGLVYEGYTQQELAKKLDCSQAAISLTYERAKLRLSVLLGGIKLPVTPAEDTNRE